VKTILPLVQNLKMKVDLGGSRNSQFFFIKKHCIKISIKKQKNQLTIILFLPYVSRERLFSLITQFRFKEKTIF